MSNVSQFKKLKNWSYPGHHTPTLSSTKYNTRNNPMKVARNKTAPTPIVIKAHLRLEGSPVLKEGINIKDSSTPTTKPPKCA